MQKSRDTILLVNEMMSTETGTFERHVEKGYRRKDVTVMTMHNAQQSIGRGVEGIVRKGEPELHGRCKSAFSPDPMDW